MLEFLRSDTQAWGEVLAVAVVLLLWLVLVWGMWVGYRGRRRRDLLRLGPLPERAPPARPPDAHVIYTGTTAAGSRIDRVAAHGLFGRGPCDVWLEPDGVVLRRHRAPVVGTGPVDEVGLVAAHAGRVLGDGRVAVLRWQLRGVSLDTGLGFPDADAAAAFAAAVPLAGGPPPQSAHPTPAPDSNAHAAGATRGADDPGERQLR